MHSVGYEKLKLPLLFSFTLTKPVYSRVICQEFVSALLSFYMRPISLQVAVAVSWQAHQTEASARN